MIYHLSLFVLQVTGAIFIVVASLWLYVVVRFRQRDPKDDSEPPQIYGSTQIELGWTVIPVLIVLVLFLTAARILFAIEDAEDATGGNPCRCGGASVLVGVLLSRLPVYRCG